MNDKTHWESVFKNKNATSVSWFQEHADRSLAHIHATGLPKTASVVDVGGGASTLVDDLLSAGFTSVTVIDISAAALRVVKDRLGELSHRVTWIEADILEVVLPVHAYDLWHDRAVFHFLTSPSARRTYIDSVLGAVKPGGDIIVATFADNGPETCSGLPVMRYNPDQLHAEFGSQFSLVSSERVEHRTPSDSVQKFIYCHFRRGEA